MGIYKLKKKLGSVGVGPSIELTSCLLPDVTVELAQLTPFT